MITYREYAPTQFDSPGLALDDRQDWLVLPCGRNRDSDCLGESNFEAALAILGGEGEDTEVHRFGHWACGWLEIIIVRPGTAAETEANSIEDAMANYPILDEQDYSERENDAANMYWSAMRTDERVQYIRDHRSQFEFHDFADMLGCARGKYFSGYPSELLSP